MFRLTDLLAPIESVIETFVGLTTRAEPVRVRIAVERECLGRPERFKARRRNSRVDVNGW